MPSIYLNFILWLLLFSICLVTSYQAYTYSYPVFFFFFFFINHSQIFFKLCLERILSDRKNNMLVNTSFLILDISFVFIESD